MDDDDDYIVEKCNTVPLWKREECINHLIIIQPNNIKMKGKYGPKIRSIRF